MLGWDLNNTQWIIVAAGAGLLTVMGVLRPWRFFQARNHCPQCKQVLARWGRWGWRDDWTCPRCGCQSGQ